MKITFYSNYLTHHQIPFCNEMYRILQENFTFVATSSMETWRIKQGWETKDDYPYVLQTEKSKEAYQEALRLARESDVVIIGAAPELFVKERMQNNTTGITLRCSERLYKRGTWRFLSPRGWLRRIDTYYRYSNRKLYMLCASAYTSGDLMLQGAYPGKCYKWGYFPKTIPYNVDELMAGKQRGKVKILWCGRFIGLKHPEAAVLVAARLKKEGYDFELNMIGSGVEKKQIKAMIAEHKLEAYVKLLGAKSPEQVRLYMHEANIFLFTSDFQEGWGAVVNEAMNSGCAVIASHAPGAVPYLINDFVNGLIYKNGDQDSLYFKVNLLLAKKELCESLGRKAYYSIVKIWNAQIAAERLLLLIEDLNRTGKSNQFQNGLCSKAEIIKNDWYKE
ncbi:MAG TPA: glycosyltransferase [Mobilitalea sp.]|nr:glycosyltransferase [Mobilitalea sp.]